MNKHDSHKINLKEKFKEDFEKVQVFVNEFDPCGLIRVGAPIDEYDCLTNRILSSIYMSKSKQEIKDLILHEIEFHFGAHDWETSGEPHKTKFYGDMEKLIKNLDEVKKSK